MHSMVKASWRLQTPVAEAEGKAGPLESQNRHWRSGGVLCLQRSEDGEGLTPRACSRAL